MLKGQREAGESGVVMGRAMDRDRALEAGSSGFVDHAKEASDKEKLRCKE